MQSSRIIMPLPLRVPRHVTMASSAPVEQFQLPPRKEKLPVALS
jgi:hypothetical protein